MSASSKKKLRKELNAAKLTERQLAEQIEAKKIKRLTGAFTALLAVVLVVAIVFASVQFISNSGIREKNTVAVTLGDVELSNAQLNYYFVDSAFQYANDYGAYASMFGLDLTKPLDQQVLNEETGATWADDFVASAIESAKATYAVCGAAEAEGYTLSQETAQQIEDSIKDLEVMAAIYGFRSADDYIKANYGRGASVKGYLEYQQMRALAQEYIVHYSENLNYDDAALRDAEAGKEAEFSNFSYNYYYVNANKFLTGGTTDENGNTTYTEEEKAEALAAAEVAAKALTSDEITSVEDFDAAIANLAINADAETPAKFSAAENYSYNNVLTTIREWVTDSSRKAGDMTYVENVSVSTNEDGTENKTVNGYYAVYFVEREDNNFPLANVRHILVKPQGGTTDPNTGATVYTEEELAAAKAKADELLKQWQDGEATEESFAALAGTSTEDPGSKDNGGLYEDVYPGQMVPAFNDWCFDASRKAGDTDIVETDYGFHIMFYSGDSETIYRDYLIRTYLVNSETETWYNGLLDAMTVTEGDTKYITRDLILSGTN